MPVAHSPHDTGGSGGAGGTTAGGGAGDSEATVGGGADGGGEGGEEASWLHIAAQPPTPLGVVLLAPSYKMHVPVECAQQNVGIVAAAAHSTAQLVMS